MRFILGHIYLIFLFININDIQAQTLLSGKIDSLDLGKKIYLSSVSQDKKIDSLIVTKDTFSFTLNAKQADIYFLNFHINSQEISWPIFLQNGSNVHLIIHSITTLTSFSGSELATEQNEFYRGMALFYDKETLLDKKISFTKDSIELIELKEQKNKINKERESYYVNWVNSHNNSPFSVAVIYLYMQEVDVNTTISLFENLSQEAKENNLATETLAEFLATKLYQQKINEQFKVGDHIKDFILNDTSGIAHSFYDLKKDSYALLDFWASWCGPCRRNNPDLKIISDKYKKDNFKIISISADTDSVEWKKAIAQDMMKWFNLSDLQGAESGFIKSQRVRAFPTYILIAPDNKIISIPNRVIEVSNYLDALFK